MTPLALDLTLLPTALAGAGAPLLKRLTLLDEGGAAGLTVYAPDPEPALAAAAGARLVRRWPTEAEIAALRVLFVAGLSPARSAELAIQARGRRVLVNVEDSPPFCDFHVPATFRRGALAVSISTGGASPTLSRRLRAYLEGLLPPEWTERTRLIETMRREMRAGGAGPAEVMRATDALIDREGWLPTRSPL